jgi:hypothetical protein
MQILFAEKEYLCDMEYLSIQRYDELLLCKKPWHTMVALEGFSTPTSAGGFYKGAAIYD